MQIHFSSPFCCLLWCEKSFSPNYSEQSQDWFGLWCWLIHNSQVCSAILAWYKTGHIALVHLPQTQIYYGKLLFSTVLAIVTPGFPYSNQGTLNIQVQRMSSENLECDISICRDLLPLKDIIMFWGVQVRKLMYWRFMEHIPCVYWRGDVCTGHRFCVLVPKLLYHTRR